MSLSQILALLEIVAKVYSALDDYRLRQEGKAEGRKEADDEANAIQLARIKAALAARVTPDPVGVPDPNDRDAIH